MYTLMSSKYHATSVGQNQVLLDNVDRIWVMSGDVIGLQQGGDVVAFTTPSQCTSNILTIDTVAAESDTVTFLPRAECRDYAIQTVTLGSGKILSDVVRKHTTHSHVKYLAMEFITFIILIFIPHSSHLVLLTCIHIQWRIQDLKRGGAPGVFALKIFL